MIRKSYLTILFTGALAAASLAQTGLERGENVSVALGGVGFDMAVDDSRSLIYVSVPSSNEIVAVSSLSFEVVGRMSPGLSPRGIDVSGDASTLYVALGGAGSVAYVDLDTFTISETVDVGVMLGDPATWDVAEGMPGEVFVSANPGSSGFAYIVRVDRNQSNATGRVAGNRIIRANPTFRVSPDLKFLYVGEGFSPNSLYKLDITQASAPIVLEDNHGSISGTNHTAIEPDGSRIFLQSGQVLNTATFSQTGMIGSGVSVVARSGDWIFVAPSGASGVQVYDTSNLSLVQTIGLQCAANTPVTLWTLDSDRGIVVLADDRLCGRVLPSSNLCSWPGTGEDLRLLSQGNTLGCKEVDVNDQVTVRLESPKGGFVGSIPVLALQVHDGTNTPVPAPEFPDLQIDPFASETVLVFQYLGGGPIGPFTLPASGLTYSFRVIPALATMSVRLQGIGLSMSAANGMYGATDAHDLAFVTGAAPAIASVLPAAAAPGENVTVLGSDFELGMDVRVGGSTVTPLAQTESTVVFAVPPNTGCNTTIRMKNPGGRSDTVGFNPAPTISQTVNSSGPATGGTPLVILGSGFVQGMSVDVDSKTANILSWTSGSLVVLTPPASPKVADVVVTSPNGCAVQTKFTYLAP